MGLSVDDVSFTLNNVFITSADGTGVVASHLAKGRLINMEVSDCADSGVYVQREGVVAFTGGRTSIHHNGHWPTRDIPWKTRDDYGMKNNGPGSKMVLEFPLTKESISHNHEGDRNWDSTFDA